VYRTPPARGPLARPRPDRPPADRCLPLAYRLRPAEEGDVPGGEQARDARLARLEAALLIADEPLPARKLASVAGLADAAEAHRLIGRLRELYDRDASAFQVEERAGGYQLRTRAAFHPWLSRLRRPGEEPRLTPAQLETLTVVAYRQPVTRADVDGIRGVQCGELIGQLMEKALVRIVGRHDSLGRPMLYGTTKKFLQLFGLNSLKDLPEVGELPPQEQS
jgi:segregation and condensation protein B